VATSIVGNIAAVTVTLTDNDSNINPAAATVTTKVWLLNAEYAASESA
jgi:hypothetical protein